LDPQDIFKVTTCLPTAVQILWRIVSTTTLEAPFTTTFGFKVDLDVGGDKLV
jgi:hypothetical protein